MQAKLISETQKMYNESGKLWNSTRSKKYRISGTQNWPVTQKYLDKLQAGTRVLDVGCGNGRLVSGLPAGVNYLGIDFSEILLAEARKSYPNQEFRYGNIVAKEAWNDLGSYEAIFCVAVLHHIPEEEQQVFVLKEMKNILKPDGFLFLSVWNLWQEKFMQSHLDSLELKKTNPRWVEIPFAKKWKRFCVQMDIPYLVEIMGLAGWDITEIFFANRDGEKTDIQTGENLVVIAR